ncbi:hypothetical protein PPYR_06984 [Photinus pyralis]|uniref:Uncharacterized protein n=1 Tax=Photinus pyralis TaxID=7054 RepID=A0A5N4AP61_PHOPY|nr:retinol dehydrogenase 11-like [Photinus pyralis]KAB0799104.1 hypothetical protein PPYR_06984 [Photinus pyralis]
MILVDVLLCLIFLKLFLKVKVRRDKSTQCLVGKTTIVTGANTGIGYWTALEFAKRGAKVIIACRDRVQGENAREKIIAATGNANVRVVIIDFRSLLSVRQFASEIRSTETRLDILVNNAAAMKLGRKTTDDGFNVTMQVNYFGPYLLTILLLDLMKRSAPSRIINVACVGVCSPHVNPKNLNDYPTGRCPEMVNYANSKLCLMLFTNELARRLRRCEVTVNSVHPGAVDSNLLRNANCCLWSPVLLLKCLCFKTPEEGSQTILHVALSEEARNVSGRYFSNCKTEWKCFTPKDAYDSCLARDVWETTEDLLHLTKYERVPNPY